ncbi:MAG TPA: family 16 glycoside hydrolase [Gemmata sp.]|jgi:hypothetical protein|nr:family 16 glycoside hydrolase [Gemmata sp.]
MTSIRLLSVAIIALAATLLPAEDEPRPAADDGFQPMFNGKDLSGWVNVNCHPSTFFTKGEEVITTGTPTGFLRTPKQYENFVLEMDWMHVNTKEVGNSGLFVWGDPLPAVGTGYTRGIEVQVLVNLEYRDKKTNAITATSHGDLFSIWGAHCTPDRPHPLGWERCLPNENYAKGGGEWNHYRVTANDGVIKLEVNGKEVSGVSKCSPRKGYLALESEGAECHFKNMKIKELPSTNPKPEDVANVADGHVSLFNGIDLTGWNSWKVTGEKLVSAKTEGLETEKKYGAGELIFDWKLPAASTATWNVEVGSQKVALKVENPGKWQRKHLTIDQGAAPAPIVFKPTAGLEIMNVFYREAK